MPLPTTATSEANDGFSHLPLDLRPLLQFVGVPVTERGVLAQATDGEISGAATDAAGHPVAHHRVELRRPRSEGGADWSESLIRLNDDQLFHLV